MNKIFTSIIAALLVLGTGAHAQDPHFTQYLSAPQVINPALTGLTERSWRATVDYRSQWATVSAYPYTTTAVSFDMALMKNKLSEGDALGIGMLGYYDQAGSAGYRNTTVGISLAYHKGFGYFRQHQLSFGMQGTFVQKSIDFTKLRFEDQYQYGHEGQLLTTNESLGNADLSYPDFSAGITYSGTVVENDNSWYCGVSWYHLTRPEETFMGNGSEKIYSRYAGYLGGSLALNDRTKLYLSGLYQQQGPAWELVYGGTLGFLLNADKGHFGTVKNTTFYIGGWFRQRDAFAPYVGLEFSGFRLGASYDITLSTAKAMALSRGGFEFSLVYNGLLSKNEKDSYNYAAPRF